MAFGCEMHAATRLARPVSSVLKHTRQVRKASDTLAFHMPIRAELLTSPCRLPLIPPALVVSEACFVSEAAGERYLDKTAFKAAWGKMAEGWGQTMRSSGSKI